MGNEREFKQLRELTSLEEVNDLLAEGWELVTTYIRDSGYPEGKNERVFYVVGETRKFDDGIREWARSHGVELPENHMSEAIKSFPW